RLGEKPFYYTIAGNNFVFASEIKSILMFPGIKRRINTGALDKFLSLRYCPGNETMVCDVFKLKPGHWLKYSNGSIEIKKYWDLKPGDINQRDESYYSGLFARLLEDSVRMRLISEVPLGIYLSGGLDSSAITAVASRALEKPVNTFSMGFGTEKESEFDYARLVSEKFGTNHKEIMVNNRSFDALPEIIWHNDEPLGDPTIIPTYFISKATKKHATVVLTGEGADELFSGYFHEKAMILADRFLANKRISGDTYAKLAKLAPDFILNKFFEYPADLGDAGKERIYRSLRNLHSNAAMYATFVENFSEEEKRGILKTYKTTASMFKDYFGGGNEISQNMLLIDREMWLPDYILLRLDRMTMANSVEGRVPYLDHRLMELSMSMPQKLKLRGFTEKYILRRAMKNILPAEILKRKKRPFITPVSEWGEKSLKEMFSAVFGERRFASDKLINPSKVFGLPNKYEKSKLITGRQMFSLLSLELWVRIFINTDPSEWKIKNLSKVCGL
ncbi:MAG: asparagine synthase (glutamine-hydrolyzing), partial [Candidatus Aenigmarchaeota archaeon]|nr:asparagine synthase (glutamine-hydrolyzing) [Candidatus Aenigmarchaeota archaeon]